MNESLQIPLQNLNDGLGSLAWYREKLPTLYYLVGILLLLGGMVVFGGGLYYGNVFFGLEGILVSFTIWEIHRSSLGYPSLQSTLFPRFIQIDDKGISQKVNGFRKAHLFAWEEIEEIREHFTKLTIRLNSSKEIEVSLSEVDYKELRLFKEITQKWAQTKQIPYC